MTGSIYRKLNSLFVSSLLLVVIIMVSWWQMLEKHQDAQNAITEVINIQKSVETLRSQLWIYLEFEDGESLNEVQAAQLSLASTLDESMYLEGQIENIKSMNEGLATLIVQERQINEQYQKGNHTSLLQDIGVKQAKLLLHSRYNMTVQGMVEELFYLQKMLIEDSAEEQSMTLFTSIFQILLFSVLVCAISLMILKRFKTGVKVIKRGILDLADGDLKSRIKNKKLDSEFIAIAEFFNQMKESLQQTTVTKDELEQEVQRQTSKLELQKEQLTFLSERDPLTGLYNRRACKNLLEGATIKAKRTGLKVALLFLDLDKFKQINDEKGHDAGDEVLRQIATRLKANIRASDFVGRIGGDEFVVCLDLLDNYDGVEAKARQLVHAFDQPMMVNGEALSVGVSIGISYYPLHTTDISCMFRMADEAMYEAKRSVEHTYLCHGDVNEFSRAANKESTG